MCSYNYSTGPRDKHYCILCRSLIWLPGKAPPVWDPVRRKGRGCAILPDLYSSLTLTLGRVFEASKSFLLPLRVPSREHLVPCAGMTVTRAEATVMTSRRGV